MPTYATKEDVVALYGDEYLLVSVDRDKDGEADEPPIVRALTSASGEIDGYLSVRYSTPIVNPPASNEQALELLKTACIDIAIYRSSSNRTVLTDEKIARYKNWIAWLKDVASGKANLPGVGDDGDPSTGPTPVTIVTEERLFSRTKLGGLF